MIYEELLHAGFACFGKGVHEIATHYVLDYGTDEQRKAWVPGLVQGELVGAIAMTEPGAGSDLRGISERRQDGYSIRDEHISGLAAPDARNPEVVLSGFLVMGTSTLAFVSALRGRLGGRSAGFGPFLLAVTGLGVSARACCAVTGCCCILPTSPTTTCSRGRTTDTTSRRASSTRHRSWRRSFCSGVSSATTFSRPWRRWASRRLAASLTLMAIFSTQVDWRGNGLVQRVMVSLPMGFMGALVWRMLRD